MDLPIENIKEVKWVDGKIYITYKDGNTFVGNAEDVRLISDYQNENNQPIIDNCI